MGEGKYTKPNNVKVAENSLVELDIITLIIMPPNLMTKTQT